MPLILLFTGGTDILGWTSVGISTSHYINGLSLDLTNASTLSPLYHVSLIAENGAGLTMATPTYSTPIYIFEDDKAGRWSPIYYI